MTGEIHTDARTGIEIGSRLAINLKQQLLILQIPIQHLKLPPRILRILTITLKQQLLILQIPIHHLKSQLLTLPTLAINLKQQLLLYGPTTKPRRQLPILQIDLSLQVRNPAIIIQV